MRRVVKLLKIVLGVIFGLSAISQLTEVYHFGIDRHLLIAVFQGLVAFFLLRTASKKNASSVAQDQEGHLPNVE